MQVDLYDPDGGTAAGVESVKIEWAPDCVAPATSNVEVAYIGWDVAMGWSASSEQRFQYSYLASPVINNGFASNKSYRLRIKSLYCNANNVTVTAWGGDNAGAPQKEIPARIVLSSVGEYGALEQAIRMNMPRKSPMSGLYDYVLFSECSLVKGEASTCP